MYILYILYVYVYPTIYLRFEWDSEVNSPEVKITPMCLNLNEEPQCSFFTQLHPVHTYIDEEIKKHFCSLDLICH